MRIPFLLAILLGPLLLGCELTIPIDETARPHVVFVRPGRVGETRILVQRPADVAPRPLSLDGLAEGVRRLRGVDPATGDSVLWVPLPTDATLYGVGTVRWSPDGTRVAAVVNSGPDQSEVVVLAADSGGGRTASPETQYVSNVAWSPDGTRLAYTMTTTSPSDLRLFVTDLATFRVTPLAPDLPVSHITELAWDAQGTGLYVTIPTADGDGAAQALRHVALATGEVRSVGDYGGFINDVAPSGARLLLTHPGADDRRDLTEVRTEDGTRTTLVGDRSVAYARYAAGSEEREALVFAGPDGDVRGYRLDLAERTLTPLPPLTSWASADLFVD